MKVRYEKQLLVQCVMVFFVDVTEVSHGICSCRCFFSVRLQYLMRSMCRIFKTMRDRTRKILNGGENEK